MGAFWLAVLCSNHLISQPRGNCGVPLGPWWDTTALFVECLAFDGDIWSFHRWQSVTLCPFSTWRLPKDGSKEAGVRGTSGYEKRGYVQQEKCWNCFFLWKKGILSWKTNYLEYNIFCSLVLLKNAALASLQHDTPKQEYGLLLHVWPGGLRGGGGDVLSYGWVFSFHVPSVLG